MGLSCMVCCLHAQPSDTKCVSVNINFCLQSSRMLDSTCHAWLHQLLTSAVQAMRTNPALTPTQHYLGKKARVGLREQSLDTCFILDFFSWWLVFMCYVSVYVLRTYVCFEFFKPEVVLVPNCSVIQRPPVSMYAYSAVLCPLWCSSPATKQKAPSADRYPSSLTRCVV